MNKSIAITGSKYTLVGTVKNRADSKGIYGLTVLVYDKKRIGADDLLDTTTTSGSGTFLATWDAANFREVFLDNRPDVYFIVKDVDETLLNTEDDPIKNIDTSKQVITLWVDDFDSDAPGAGKVPAEGWVGGFAQSNPDFAYDIVDLSSLGDLKDNMANIKLLDRQQKVLWPEFSWLTVLKDETSRAYQMFAPDISRLGYTNEGRVYSIICPQQGTCFTSIGCMNVEVTVTGNRGWVDEAEKSLYADMGVVGKVWFTPSALQAPKVKSLWDKFASSKLPFPSDKEHAIVVKTFKPDSRTETTFPLIAGQTKPEDFKIPDFAKHEDEAWSVANLNVEIGPIEKTENAIVNDFNQLIMDIFNLASGNMLRDTNVLSWNVWFIAPQHVNRVEWSLHAEKWRLSINADHGSPMGEGTDPKYFDGSPFKLLKSLGKEEEEIIKKFESFERLKF